MIKKFKPYWEAKIKKLDIWDISIIKSTSVLFGIIIGAYAADFVIQEIKIIFGAFLVGIIFLVHRMFKSLK